MSPDDLKTAKFRGIECSARDLGLKAGRRVVREVVPGRDGEVSEDLGRAAREYKIQFVCSGADWKDTYNRLIVAVEDPNPAEFQHPDGTILQVIPDGGFEFSVVSVGEATVDATLVELTATNRVAAEEDAKAAAATAADAADTTSAGRLSDNLTGGAAAATAIANITEGMRLSINIGKQAGAAVGTALDLIDADVASIVQAPITAASYFTTLYRDIEDWPMLSQALSRYHESELLILSDYAALTDPTAQEYMRDEFELNLHCLHCAIAQMARIVNNAEYAAFDDAQAAVSTVADWIDTVAPYSNAVQLAAVADLQAQLVESVLNGAQQMPRLKDFTPWRVMSADEIAQYLYQDGTRAGEIVARNKVQHPGFIGPDQVLKVLEV